MPAAAVLPDVLAPNLAVVFCGSAAGSRSAALGAYYAGPGNRFWPLLFELGLTPCRLEPARYRLVLRYGIGLTDLAKRASGPDASLPRDGDDPWRLRRVVQQAAPTWLAFNGKRPAAVFLGRRAAWGEQPERVGTTRIFVLPSTSRANVSFSTEPWHAFAELARTAGAGLARPAPRER